MDLATSYLGLALRNPLVAAASPLSNTVDGVRRLAGVGVGAIVLYSLFEEQVRREMQENARLAEAGGEYFAESLPTASALIRHGPRHAATLLAGLLDWMARKGYESAGDLRGKLALPPDTDQAAYQRAGYVPALQAANSARRPW